MIECLVYLELNKARIRIPYKMAIEGGQIGPSDFFPRYSTLQDPKRKKFTS